MPAIVFKSQRLLCRRWVPSDLEALAEVYGDPEAMRYVGDGVPLSRAQCAQWLTVTEDNYATRGYGMFTVLQRDLDELVGFAGLVHPGGQADVEIKYALRRLQWGQGLASEIVPQLLAYGARVHGLQRIMATVAPENLASQKVLAKAGMSLARRRTDEDGSETLVYVWRWPGAD